jgi:hypothetical protein
MTMPEATKTPSEATAILDEYMRPELTFCVSEMDGSTRMFPVDFRLRIRPCAAPVRREISQDALAFVRGGDRSEQHRLRQLLAAAARELRAATTGTSRDRP